MLFFSSFFFSQVGTIGGTYLAALFIHHFNSWHQVFYYFGIGTIVWCFLFVRFHVLIIIIILLVFSLPLPMLAAAATVVVVAVHWLEHVSINQTGSEPFE